MYTFMNKKKRRKEEKISPTRTYGEVHQMVKLNVFSISLTENLNLTILTLPLGNFYTFH